MTRNFDELLLASLAEKTLARLKQLKKTIAVSESCTGGLLATLLTEWPGSSAVFMGGLCVYSNYAKERILGVPRNLLIEFGAVSEDVALEMAEHTKKLFAVDYAISITGIAGPDGGTLIKPVGTVFHGFSTPHGNISFQNSFPGTRSDVRKHAVRFALETLLKELSPEIEKTVTGKTTKSLVHFSENDIPAEF